MDKISELKTILKKNFSWNKARLDCFAKMLLALIAVRTVNLSEIAIGFASKASVSSRYKRIYRFFREFKIDRAWVAKWIFKLFLPTTKIYITIDRTNWFWGKTKINILMLGMAYEGIAIPLLWQLLDKAGNATAKEHQAIIERFLNLFGKEHIAGVLGDREFGSASLFNWCNQNNLPFFYIRIKEGSIVKIKGKSYQIAEKLFRYLNPKESSFFGMDVEIFGIKVNLAGARSERGELMIVATNETPKNAIAIYLRRWEIENLFQALKGRGFRFEETHLTHLARIEKLMALLAIAFSWAHKVGEWRASKKAIVLKKHRDSMRPQNNFFRYGLDFMREIMLSPFKKIADFRRCLDSLSPLQTATTGVL